MDRSTNPNKNNKNFSRSLEEARVNSEAAVPLKGGAEIHSGSALPVGRELLQGHVDLDRCPHLPTTDTQV